MTDLTDLTLYATYTLHVLGDRGIADNLSKLSITNINTNFWGENRI